MKPIKSSYFVDYYQLRLHVYVVGYKPIGETILTILAEGENPLLTILTDCYCRIKTQNGKVIKKYNVIEKILDNWGNPDIDIFIWTHPHEDHSVGIIPLLESYDKNHQATVFIPDNFVDYDNQPSVKAESKETYRFLLKNYNCNNNLIFVGKDRYDEPTYFCSFTNSQDVKVKVEFIFFAPHKGIVARYASTKSTPLNHTSIAYRLHIDNIDIFMGGDLDEECVGEIEPDNFQHINLIKIPHHTSNQIVSLHPRFTVNTCEDPVHAATTVFFKGRRHLPDVERLNDYLRLTTTVHCTCTKADSKHKYGCVEYVYVLSNAKLTDVIPSGMAYDVRDCIP